MWPGALRAEPSLSWSWLCPGRLEASAVIGSGPGLGCACPLLGRLAGPAVARCVAMGAAPRAGPGLQRVGTAEAGHGSEMLTGPMPAGAAPPGCLLCLEAVGGASLPHGPGPRCVLAWASRAGLPVLSVCVRSLLEGVFLAAVCVACRRAWF